MRLSRFVQLALAVALLSGCGQRDDRPRGLAPTGTPATPPPPEPLNGAYSIHEWGVLAYDAVSTDQTVVVAGSPWLRTTGHGSRGTIGHGGGGGSGSGLKPVLYVHLAEGARGATFSATVLARHGTVIESWPLGTPTTSDDGQGVRWEGVVATADRARCDGAPLAYPTFADPPCSTAPDHFCEAQNAREYETPDGACLQTGPDRYAKQLFYRASITRDGLPFDVVREGRRFVVRAREGAEPTTLVLVHRGPIPSMTRAVRFDAPAAGASVPVPTETEAEGAALVEREIFVAATRMGLSGPERVAFRAAWDHAITARGQATGGWTLLRGAHPALRVPIDALYYWLPASRASAILPLTFEPAPTEVSRALLVRISLDPPRPPPGPEVENTLVMNVSSARGLTTDVVRRVGSRHGNEIRFCGELSMNVRTRITMAWDIDATGATRVVEAATEPPNPELTECAVLTLGRWTFPAPTTAPGRARATWDLTPVGAEP